MKNVGEVAFTNDQGVRAQKLFAAAVLAALAALTDDKKYGNGPRSSRATGPAIRSRLIASRRVQEGLAFDGASYFSEGRRPFRVSGEAPGPAE